jgi:hypothetical protein
MKTHPIINIESAGQHDDVVITMAYHQDAVDIIKALPDFARSWSAAERAWRVHPAYARSLAVTLHRLGFALLFDNVDMFADSVALDAVDHERRSA